jgi:hypothetical protein
MKTRDQKHDNKFSMRIARWWVKVIDWAEDIDFGEICLNVFLVLLIGGTIFGVGYLAIHKSSKDKVDTIAADSTVAEKHCEQCAKSCAVDWDLDTITVLAPNEKGYKLHFKGKIPYYLTIENLDSIQ